MIRNTMKTRMTAVLFQIITLAAGGSMFQYGCGGGYTGLGGWTDYGYGYNALSGASDYASSVTDWSAYGWGSLMRDEDYLGYGDWVDVGSPISNDWW